MTRKQNEKMQKDSPLEEMRYRIRYGIALLMVVDSEMP